MHAILVPVGSAGDVYPFIALGRELQRRGHRITMITSGIFGDLARRAGFEFKASLSSEAYQAIVSDPDYWHPLRSTRLLLDRIVSPAIAVVYALVKESYRPGDSAVVAGTLALGARVAQEALGLPLTTVHLQPSAIRSCRAPALHPGFGWMRQMPLALRPAAFRLIDAIADRLYGGPLNSFRATLGLPPVRRLFGSWWHSPESTLGLFPAWYAAPQADWPRQIRLCDFPLFNAPELEVPAEELERYLEAGEPPIVFTCGSAMSSAHEFFAAATQACRMLGRRALFVTRFTRHLPRSLPANVTHVAYAPFGRLLPRTAAIVHHGGIGTTAQALRAGLPQIVTPYCYDQYDNADHLMRLGVALTVTRSRHSAERIAGSLDRLQADRVLRARCLEISQRFTSVEPLGEAADALERYWFERRILPQPGERLLPASGPAAPAPSAA